MVLFLILQGGNKTAKKSGNKNTNTTDNTNKTDNTNTDPNSNVVAEVAKKNAEGFVIDLENYASLSQAGISGYDKQVPISIEGNVTCTTTDGKTWTGTVADGSESCNNFMNAVVTKTSLTAPTEAKIILTSQGKLQNSSWLKYNEYYCAYNGMTISDCSTTKLN